MTAKLKEQPDMEETAVPSHEFVPAARQQFFHASISEDRIGSRRMSFAASIDSTTPVSVLISDLTVFDWAGAVPAIATGSAAATIPIVSRFLSPPIRA